MVDSIYFLDIRLEYWTLVLASIAILFAVLKDFILPFIFKPKIHIEGIDDGECIENASDDVKIPGEKLSRWVRLRIINKNSFFSVSAKNCHIKLLSIKNKKGKKITPFNLIPLTWVNYDEENKGGKHDLSIGEYHLIDLVHEKSYVNRILCFKFNQCLPLELRKKTQKEFGPGSYIFNVGIYGDNFKPQQKDFRIKFPKKFGKINFA